MATPCTPRLPSSWGSTYSCYCSSSSAARPSGPAKRHPEGFYITFTGPATMASVIAEIGCFTSELYCKSYRPSLDGVELAVRRKGLRWTDRKRREFLRWAAAAWEQERGERVETVRRGYRNPVVALATALANMNQAVLAGIIRLQEQGLWSLPDAE